MIELRQMVAMLRWKARRTIAAVVVGGVRQQDPQTAEGLELQAGRGAGFAPCKHQRREPSRTHH